MGECAIFPKVKNKDNQLVDSKLFKDLLSYTGDRGTTVLTYVWAASKDFSDYKASNKYDENGQPTLEFLHSQFDLTKVVDDKKLISQVEKKSGMMKSNGEEVTFMSENKAFDVAKSFNTTSPLRNTYQAFMKKIYTGDRGKESIAWRVRLEKRGSAYSIEANKQQYNDALNEKIRTILSKFGVSVGALTELEKRLGISGVMDTTGMTISDGMVELIRLADGVKGEKALPEEFAHFIYEALQDTPLGNRLLNVVVDNNMAKEILGEEFDKYNEMYESNEVKLAKEAIGKLLAEHLLKEAPIPKSRIKTLLERFIDLFKRLFGSNNSIAKGILAAREEVNKAMAGLATDVMSGKLDSQISEGMSNLSSIQLYNTTDRVSKSKELLSKIIDTEEKRIKIYEENKKDNIAFTSRQRGLITELQSKLYRNQEVEGIFKFLDHTLSELTKVDERLKALRKDPAYLDKVNESAGVIRDASNYVSAYGQLLKDIQEELRTAEVEGDERYEAQVRQRLNDVRSLMESFSSDFITLGKPLITRFLEPFLGSSKQIIMNGKKVSLEEILDKADSDLGFFDRWIFSMADSKDPLLRLLDLGVKKAHSSSRMRAISLSKELQDALIKLEKAGVKGTDWMLKKDSNGNKTGLFISELDVEAYRKAEKLEMDRLKKLHTREDGTFNAAGYTNDRYSWLSKNREVVNGKERINSAIYGDKTFMSLNQAQREYYDTVIRIKKELDDFLPTKYANNLLAPQVRKDMIERVKTANSLKGAGSVLVDSFKDNFKRREDDEAYGHAHLDFKENQVEFLPIYYTKRLDNPNDISDDITSSMIAYATMAIDYDEMNKIVDALELTRDIIRERQVVQTKNGKPIIERIKTTGRDIENTLTKQGQKTAIMQKVDDFFASQVYGRYIKDEGTFGKVVDNVNKYTAIANLGLNVMAGISNPINATIMSNIEAVAGEFFSAKDLAKSDKNYVAGLPALVAQIGDRVQTSKLALFNEYLNSIQGHVDKKLKNMDMDKKRFGRVMSLDNLTFLMECGEHWIQSRTSLAIAEQTKMKGPDGKVVGLYDAMEVVGGRLKIKEGFTKEDGTEFTEDDRFKLENRISTINRKLNGTYNKADKAAVQQMALGRSAFLFRNWMVDAFNRRFQDSKYDFSLESEYEGYYRTSAKFVYGLVKDLKTMSLNMSESWNELTPHQKANMKRAITEVTHFILISLALGVISWSDDKNRPWLEKMSEYQLRRMQTEIGAMIPNPTMLQQGLKLIQSPAAGIDAVNKVLNIFKVTTWGDKLESGPYKDSYKIEKYLLDITPYKGIKRALNPEEGIDFLKTQ